MGVAKEIGVGEMAKIADPSFGKLRLLLERRRRQGGEAAGEIGQTVIPPSLSGGPLLQLREIHVGGQVLSPGVREPLS